MLLYRKKKEINCHTLYENQAKYYDELSGRKRWFINMCCGNKRKLMYYKTATMQKQLEFIGDDNAFISSAVFNHGKEWKNIIRHDYFGYYIAPQFEQLAHDIADAVPTATVTSMYIYINYIIHLFICL